MILCGYILFFKHDDALAGRSGAVYAVKLYPAGATTNSQDGVTDLFGKCLPVLEEMVEHDMPLLVLFLIEHFISPIYRESVLGFSF